ncbi:zf-HC2 domain-containing protein [Paraburkholderia sprentiae WSM5005]|uniref:Zf-HC2 domain-containing protein n=1 Tax=Paraburkholderia sprentiae WSM5005 TaxID=754502 RepID=A0A1I9YFA7_9BURK|nr:zf-HC2 domain-containing protein [Paraburkholderia sprentiae]APA84990.1 zf-HC2 domain-containing protein [Paraburkholderia sprentiae WSM5005]
MDCNEARPLLDANADHELPAPDARRVQQHIESCDDCRRVSDNLRALSGALRAAPYHRAPQALRARIVAGLPGALDKATAGSAATAAPDDVPKESAGNAATGITEPATQEPRRQRRGARWPAWLAGWFRGFSGSGGADRSGAPSGRCDSRGRQADAGGGSGWTGFGGPLAAGGVNRAAARGGLAALVIALCAAAAVLTLTLRRPAEFTAFTDELVASHVRAQISGRDIDVISTDRHTVKPWFNGRIDYSPPVEDLAASGFALQGGRLDYLAHRRVAVLVYRSGKHVIDVYVLPQSAAGGAAPASLGHDGYSIAHWDAAGMTWWAITDAAPDALSGFEAALRARLQSGSQRTEAG